MNPEEAFDNIAQEDEQMNPGTWGLVEKLALYKRINKEQAEIIRSLRAKIESQCCEHCESLHKENDDLVDDLLKTRRERDAFKESLRAYVSDDSVNMKEAQDGR